MADMIVGFERFGYQLQNDVIRYCQETGHPNRPDLHKNIYQEVVSQVFSQMTPDFQAFMANLMMLPDWKTIHYLEEPLDYSRVDPFKQAVRAFAILLWHRLYTRDKLNENYVFVFQSCNADYAYVKTYLESNDV